MLQSPYPSWRPSPFLKLGAAAHVGAGVGAVLAPGLWPFWAGAVLATHAVATISGLLPRSTLLGPNLVRLPPQAAARREVALTFDDGPDPEVTPHVLDMLDGTRHRATFFCIAERVRQHPELALEIVRRGHLIENHTDTHPHSFAASGPRKMALEIDSAQRSLHEITGRAPQFFRAVAGLRNPFLDPLLARRGLRLASWTRRPYDTRSGDAITVLHRLTRGLTAGDILLMHDGHSARSATGGPVILNVLAPLLAALEQQGLHSVTLQSGCIPIANHALKEAQV